MRILIKPLLALTLFSLVACDDILEEDISDENIQIISPLDGTEISSNAVTFRWHEVDGADDYRIQVFSASQNMVLDSLVSGSNFIYAMQPGDYQWRVRGENFAYHTDYTFPVSFTVFESDDLTSQHVFLSNPSDNFYTNNGAMVFVWQSLAAADNYDFQLVNVTNSQTIVNSQENLTNTSLSLPSSVINNVNAEYQWKIRAKNSTSQTAFTSRTFKFDNVLPAQSQNSTPANNSTVTANTEISFTWTAPADSGVIQSPISYVIEIATDNTFSTILQASDVATNSASITLANTGDYYWRVKAKDLAGNVGNYSVGSKLTVN